MAGHHDPRLLYSIQNITASQIQNGEAHTLTPSGPQTLSLLMVPTSSPFADLSSHIPQNEIPEEDFFLHLHLPPELDLPLPATTQIYHQPPRSYLIPRWDRGPDAGVFTRIEFPSSATQEDIETFETILAQCTAFLERAAPPTGDKSRGVAPYDPRDWAPGGKYGGGKTEPGHVVLIDENDGSIVGELAEDAQIVEDPSLAHGTKQPVEITVTADGKRVDVRPISEDYLKMSRMPQYKDSSIVQNAAVASRLIVTGSTYLGDLMSSGADSFTQKTKPVQKPMTFSPKTHERVRKVHTFSASGRDMSSKTFGSVTKHAQNMTANVFHRNAAKDKAAKDSKSKDKKPGLMNKSLIAFTTVADGIAESSKSLLNQGSAAASTVVGHRYGAEAGSIAGDVAGGFRNVGLVYIDVTGVTRRAVIKSVAKGMVIGHVKGGGEVVVGGGDGGAVPESDIQKMRGAQGAGNTDMHQGEPTVAGFGRSAGGSAGAGAGAAGAPPPYEGGGIGENISGTGTEKRGWH